MAFAGRFRSTLPLIRKISAVDSSSSVLRSGAVRSPTVTNPELSRNYATAPASKEQRVKVPIKLYGLSGNYASALYLAAVKANTLDKVESELLDFVEATKKSTTFSLFMKDLSMRKDTRVKAMNAICAHAKFSDITNNFLILLAENGRLRNVERMATRFKELTMAHRGEVKAIVTTVIPLPPQEEKEMIETLQEMIGQGKKVIVEQKVDPNILGGLVVEFSQKVFDMSIRTRARQMERFLRDPVNIEGL
ncbi:ATP synthase [Lithospermum erythrorhizon]|uniref:ATP synthase n=1 Tax=Lithospermum erythrorhizon TaxID=34254 RepID=A0AAV3PPL0_LITER